jgi:hydroxyacylglutathione hydrolase
LIDTGWGVENLANYIKEITKLPVVVANTHGHMDHALGNDVFDYVYIGLDDLTELNTIGINDKKNYAQNSKLLIENNSLPDFNVWGSPAGKESFKIEDHLEFNLGDRVVTAFLTPGHTSGSTCFYDNRSKVLFTGDSYVPLDFWGPMWLHLAESVSLSAFQRSIKIIEENVDYKFLLSGHGECGLLPASRLNAMSEGIKKVLNGEITGSPERTLKGEGLRCNFDNVSIIYDPLKL